MPESELVPYLLAGAALFSIGLFGLIGRRHLLRRILGANIMGSGVFLVFIAKGSSTDGQPADPVAQAMVLTGIVVAVCGTGLALALAERVQATTGRLELPRWSDE